MGKIKYKDHERCMKLDEFGDGDRELEDSDDSLEEKTK